MNTGTEYVCVCELVGAGDVCVGMFECVTDQHRNRGQRKEKKLPHQNFRGKRKERQREGERN